MGASQMVTVRVTERIPVEPQPYLRERFWSVHLCSRYLPQAGADQAVDIRNYFSIAILGVPYGEA